MAPSLLPLAVVHIEDSPAMLVIIGIVLLLAFLGVAFVAYHLLTGRVRSRADGGMTFNTSSRLPVSKATFDRLAAATEAGLEVPRRTPETEAFLTALGRSGRAARSLSRMLALGGGVVLLALAVTFYWQSTPANMLLLPAGILALLGAGAVLKGLTPERRVEPIDPQLLEKIRVTASAQPATVRLDELALIQAAELRRGGASWEEVARHVHPGFSGLSPYEQAAVAQAIGRAVDAAARGR